LNQSLAKPPHVRFGLLADIAEAKRYVRFVPEADIFTFCDARAMSAFNPKAHIRKRE
jgi:hypothetical protein